jgi:ribosomal protein S18 acetylase RimI-like enzyme
MSSLTFHPADRHTFDELSALLTRAYTGYSVPVQIDAAGFESMVNTYDIDLTASRVGVVGGAPVALALLGVRGHRGWIGGMGVVPARRGQGVGTAVMRAVINSARARALRSIDLEVLTNNTPAAQIYERLGFKRRRILDTWTRESDSTFPMPPRDTVEPLDVAGCLSVFEELHAVTPPWQRDLPVLQRLAADLHTIGIMLDDHVVSYLMYRMDGARVRIVDVAAAPGHRTTTIESMLRALIRDRSGSPIRLVNLPQDDPASSVMHRIGAAVEMQQHEMTLDL